MKIRTLFLTLAFILAAIPVLLAKVVTKEQARLVAHNFLTERINNNQIDWNVDNLSIKDISTFEAENQPAVYAFSNNGLGFVLVSADDVLTPILGYSTESNLSAPGTNPNFEYMLSEYVNQVKYVRNNNLTATSDVEHAWFSYLSGQLDRSPMDDVTVGPLVTTLWNQGTPYNDFCPLDAAGPGGHVYAGCVATAMSMVMNYYKYPITGNGSHSYNAPNYGTQSVNYGVTTYEWDAMQNTVSGASGDGIPANALLQYHAGVAVNMHYAPDGSGAYSTDVPNAVKTYFKYSPSTAYASRSSYSLVNWEALLTSQLNAKTPLYYSGQDPTGGHAWVCDGYQITGTTQLFHFNFGWSGQDNGYYTSSNPNGFTTSQAIIKDFYPNPANYPYGCSANTLYYSRGSIEDGSGPLANYNDNLGCTWLIAPTDTVKSITVNFIRFEVSSSDMLYFYNGEDESAPLIGAYSGTTLPANVTANGNRMFIKFVTDGSVVSDGWLLEYSSTFPALCTGPTLVLTSPSGSFTDGSGSYNYKNNSLCKFRIQPPFASNLTLTFNEFDLLDGDFITVKALADNSTIATLTGSLLPDPITVPNDGLYLVFQSDAYYTSTGFSASYTIGNVNTKSLPGINSLDISPNPASSFIMLRAFNSKTQQLQIALNDMAGKNLYAETITAKTGQIEKSIDISTFKSGMYFLTIKSPEGKITEKVIVK